jgi:hypothetical protein
VTTTILLLLCLISAAAAAALYGWLESSANMIEMLVLPFTSAGKTAGGALAFGGPFLLLFIAAGLGVFMAVPLVTSAVLACLGGWALRRTGRSVSRRVAVVAVVLTACATIVVVLAGQRGGWIPDRPANRPKTSSVALACLAGANAALSVFVATGIVRWITSKPRTR